MRSGVGKQKKGQALEYQKYLFSISAWCIDWEMALAITMRMASSHLKVIRQNCIFFFLCRLHLGTALWENACLIGCVSRPQAPGALCSCICVCAQSTRQTTTTSIRNFSFFFALFRCRPSVPFCYFTTNELDSHSTWDRPAFRCEQLFQHSCATDCHCHLHSDTEKNTTNEATNRPASFLPSSSTDTLIKELSQRWLAPCGLSARLALQPRYSSLCIALLVSNCLCFKFNISTLLFIVAYLLFLNKTLNTLLRVYRFSINSCV